MDNHWINQSRKQRKRHEKQIDYLFDKWERSGLKNEERKVQFDKLMQEQQLEREQLTREMEKDVRGYVR